MGAKPSRRHGEETIDIPTPTEASRLKRKHEEKQKLRELEHQDQLMTTAKMAVLEAMDEGKTKVRLCYRSAKQNSPRAYDIVSETMVRMMQGKGYKVEVTRRPDEADILSWELPESSELPPYEGHSAVDICNEKPIS